MTGIYQPLNQSLEKANRLHHENATCPRCESGQQYSGTEWVKREEFSRLDHFGWPLAFNAETGEVLFLSDYCHNLTIGSTGTGKTEVYVKNAIRLMAELPDHLKPSFLITDQKGDLGEQMVPVLEKNGYTVFVMNMKSPYYSCHYNFLLPVYDRYIEGFRLKEDLDHDRIDRVVNGVEYPDKETARQAAYCLSQENLEFVERGIVELAHIVVPSYKAQDETWYSGARTILQAVIWGLLHDAQEPELTGITRDKFTLATVLGVTRHTDSGCDELIDWLRKVPNNACVETAISGVLNIKAQVTRDGYISTLQSATAIYNAASIGAITATKNSLDLHEIAMGDKPFAVVLITDDRQKATNNVAAMLLNNFINEAVDIADRNPNHALSRNFLIMADEFANMPALPNLENRITTLRSRRVWLMMAIQSIQQLDKVYTHDVSSIVQDNCDLNLFLGCNNDATKDSFARSMGRHLGVKTSYSIQNDGAMAVQKGSENVPLVKKSDLDAMQLGEIYVRARRAQNLLTTITPYFIWAKGDPCADLRGGNFCPYDPALYAYDLETRERKERELRREQEQREDAGTRLSRFFGDSSRTNGRRFSTLAGERREGEGAVEGEGASRFVTAKPTDRVSPFPRDGEKLFARYGVRIEARKEGGWSIFADLSALKHAIETPEEDQKGAGDRWYEYRTADKRFSATCSDSMRAYVLARLYSILQGPVNATKELLLENGSKNLSCVFRLALENKSDMTREEMLARLQRMATIFEESEDWYMLTTIRQTYRGVEKMSDAMFGLVKRHYIN